MFTLITSGGNYYYDQAQSLLTDSNGNQILTDIVPPKKWHSGVFSSLPAKAKVKVLKIQLGLKCNYSCQYCNQASFVTVDDESSLADVDKFVDTLDCNPTRIEYWGGEPFAYFKKMRYLHSKLQARFSQANYTIITNGSVLTDEIIDWIVDTGGLISISHDGPGQYMRGPDPFADEISARQIKRLFDLLNPQGLIAFTCVLTKDNYSLDAVMEYLEDKLHSDKVVVFTEEVMLAHDSQSADLSPDNSTCKKISNTIADEMLGGRAMTNNSVNNKVADFMRSLRDKQPAVVLGQKCGMDKPENLAIDLKGRQLVCQNVVARDKFKITHHSLRPDCPDCLVLQLCKGSCMFLQGKQWQASCKNSFAYNYGIFKAVIKKLTGFDLLEINKLEKVV